MAEQLILPHDSIVHLLHHRGCKFTEITFAWCFAYGAGFVPDLPYERGVICRECEHRMHHDDPAIPDTAAVNKAKKAEKQKAKKK